MYKTIREDAIHRIHVVVCDRNHEIVDAKDRNPEIVDVKDQNPEIVDVKDRNPETVDVVKKRNVLVPMRMFLHVLHRHAHVRNILIWM